MTELRALARERELRGYSKLRKAEIIAFLQDNGNWAQQQCQSWSAHTPSPTGARGPALGTECQQEGPITKRQCKCRRAKDNKLAKHFVNLNSETNTLKLQMEELKEKISHASKSAHSGFKRKKIRTMKRDVDKISAQLAESEACLLVMRVPKDPISGAPLKQHPPSRPKCIEVKIAELNKKICNVKNGGKQISPNHQERCTTSRVELGAYTTRGCIRWCI